MSEFNGLHERIRRLGHTQKTFAKEAKVSQGTISRLCINPDVGLHYRNYKKIADTLARLERPSQDGTASATNEKSVSNSSALHELTIS
jgi:predicted transcriptional regulator